MPDRAQNVPFGTVCDRLLAGLLVAPQGEERLGDSLLDGMRRVQRKAWELVAKAESEGDHRGAIVALREVRECLESLGDMLAKAGAAQECGVTLAQVLEARRRLKA